VNSVEPRSVGGVAMLRRSMSPPQSPPSGVCVIGRKVWTNGLPGLSGPAVFPVASWYGLALGTPK
jgi:hypothetical protein